MHSPHDGGRSAGEGHSRAESAQRELRIDAHRTAPGSIGPVAGCSDLRLVALAVRHDEDGGEIVPIVQVWELHRRHVDAWAGIESCLLAFVIDADGESSGRELNHTCGSSNPDAIGAADRCAVFGCRTRSRPQQNYCRPAAHASVPGGSHRYRLLAIPNRRVDVRQNWGTPSTADSSSWVYSRAVIVRTEDRPTTDVAVGSDPSPARPRGRWRPVVLLLVAVAAGGIGLHWMNAVPVPLQSDNGTWGSPFDTGTSVHIGVYGPADTEVHLERVDARLLHGSAPASVGVSVCHRADGHALISAASGPFPAGACDELVAFNGHRLGEDDYLVVTVVPLTPGTVRAELVTTAREGLRKGTKVIELPAVPAR